MDEMSLEEEGAREAVEFDVELDGVDGLDGEPLVPEGSVGGHLKWSWSEPSASAVASHGSGGVFDLGEEVTVKLSDAFETGAGFTSGYITTTGSGSGPVTLGPGKMTFAGGTSGGGFTPTEEWVPWTDAGLVEPEPIHVTWPTTTVHPEPEEPLVQLNVRLPEKVRDELKLLAATVRRPMGELVSEWISRELLRTRTKGFERGGLYVGIVASPAADFSPAGDAETMKVVASVLASRGWLVTDDRWTVKPPVPAVAADDPF